MLHPEPAPGDVPINEPATADIAVGERATYTFTIKNRVSELIIPIVAASKFPSCIYQVRADGRDRYGPAQVPPTDVDDLAVTFLPALRFADTLTVEVTNLGNSDRTVHVQPVGWEPQSDGGSN